MRIVTALGLLILAGGSHALTVDINNLPTNVQADVLATYGSNPLDAQLIGNKTWALHYNSSTIGDAWLIHYSLGPTSFHTSAGGNVKPPMTEGPPTTTYLSGDVWVAMQSQYTYTGNAGDGEEPFWLRNPNSGSVLLFANLYGIAGNCNPCQFGLLDKALDHAGGGSWNTGPGSSIFFINSWGATSSTLPGYSYQDFIIGNSFNFINTGFDETGKLYFDPNDTRTLLFSYYSFGNRGYDHSSQRTELYVEPVPIPAAGWLFGSALAGLCWRRREAKYS